MTDVLVAFGSKRGGTAEIARWIGDELTERGVNARVRPAGGVRDLRGCDAVVLGGALYANRWHRDARRFARRFRAELRDRPVWLFSSGPLDEAVEKTQPRVPPSVERIAARTNARDHVTFGGRIAPDARGFVASRIARSRSGDFRDRERIRAWAQSIADDLAKDPPA
ncbi:flavodoxin domain-containing protein [Actinomadura gamaensis]|uniref:Flavodoxin domain-containing protein n=1 Tax=Actinomadura gamaensis TaxID=1763541 RepID=A0ABV9TUP6_9ACTN